MPCFAANASAFRRSRAATHAISTSSTPFAGPIRAIGAIRAAPRMPTRSFPFVIAPRVITARAQHPTRSTRRGAHDPLLDLGLLLDRRVERLLDRPVALELLGAVDHQRVTLGVPPPPLLVEEGEHRAHRAE